MKFHRECGILVAIAVDEGNAKADKMCLVLTDRFIE